MREIVFRGKRRDTGKWVEGYFVHCKSEWEEERVAEIIPPETDRIYRGEYDLYDVHEVDPDTVGQFTGLTDKNGTRIFEGDIVRVERWLYSGENKKEREVFNGVVWYDEKRTCFGLRSTKYRCLPIARFKGDYITVIGNIHDNPELLEGDQNETQ